MYKEVKDPWTHQINSIKRLSDGAFIPLDPDNSDYRAFMAWHMIPGNNPEPAD